MNVPAPPTDAPSAGQAPPPQPPPLPPPATPPRTPEDRAQARRLLLGLLVAGVTIDLVLRSHVAGLAGTASVVASAGVILLSGRVVNRQAAVLLLLAVVPGAFLSVRTSPWLVPLDALAAAGLVVVAAILARGGDLRDLDTLAITRRACRLFVALVSAPALLLDRLAAAVPAPDDASREQLRSVARGLGIAVPVLAVVGLLLASADAVFASFFSLPLDLGSAFGHLLGAVVGAWVASALVWMAVDDGDLGDLPRARFGAAEATVVLGGLVGLYGLFVVAQVIAAGAGESYIVETTGLTRAEYARSGFFQLLWAAGLTVAVLLGLHATTAHAPSNRRRLALLNGLAISLTIVVVVTAVRRLGLYDDAFGLTMLRLYSTIFAWWLGVVLLLVGAYLVMPPGRRWLTAGIGASALAALVVVNVANPEQLVVEHNVERAVDGAEVDVVYLAGLSDDAIPALVGSLERLATDDRTALEALLCTDVGHGSGGATSDGSPWYGANLSTTRAGTVLASLCDGSA